MPQTSRLTSLILSALAAGFFIASIFPTARARAAPSARRIYVNVNASAEGDGSSWAQPMRRLEQALQTAVYGDEIWVAQGVYPAATVNDLNTKFVVPDGVRMYGGFAGDESLLDQRDVTAHETILSGLLPGFETWTMRAIRVLWMNGVTEATRVDGFTIRDASAPGPACWTSLGDGITNCDGNGIILSGSPILANLRIVANQFENLGHGGGIAHFGGALHLDHVVFEGNTASSGGAIYSVAPDAVYLTNTKVISNTANTGGGVYIENPIGIVSIHDSTIEGNGSLNGGGLYLSGTHEVRIVGALIASNYAPTGAALHARNASVTMAHVTLAQNLGERVALCHTGSTIYAENDSRLIFVNSLAARNFAPIALLDSSTLAAKSSLIDEQPFSDGSVDPEFVTAFTIGSPCMRHFRGDYRLRAASPAIDAGNLLLVPSDLTTDLDGAPRVNGSSVDLGAYEWNASTPTVTPTQPGTVAPSPTPQPTPTATATGFHTATPQPTQMSTPTATPTQTDTAFRTATPQPTDSPTSTPLPVPAPTTGLHAPFAGNAAFLGTHEAEPNDAYWHANGPLRSGRQYSAVSTNGAPPEQLGGAYKDYFYIDLPSQGAIEVTLTGAGPDAQLQLYREGAIGVVLNGNPFVHTFTYADASPGRYYVYVNFPRISADFTYTLRVTY